MDGHTMSFFDVGFLSRLADIEVRVALRDGERCLTYAELDYFVGRATTLLSQTPRELVIFRLRRRIEDIVYLLAVLRGGHVPLIVPEGASTALIERLQRSYSPGLSYGIAEADNSVASYGFLELGSEVFRKRGFRSPVMSPELGVLMLTSGSTGSPKVVRLSRDNVLVNAKQIVDATRISSTDIAITSLPLSYSFGLSVLFSHLQAGASVVLTNRSVLDLQFWSIAERGCVTTLAGVPVTFEMMQGAKLTLGHLPSLKKILQAGGGMRQASRSWLREFCGDVVELFVMYGQTEATARMTVLSPEELKRKQGSVGLPVLRGSIRTSLDGEIIYSGPNVMLGYAYSAEDLWAGDLLAGILHTKDRGWIDEEGFLYVIGRMDRVIKLSGIRIDLVDLEVTLSKLIGTEVAIIQTARDRLLACYVEQASDVDDIIRRLEKEVDIPPRTIRSYVMAELPRLDNGKIDYRALLQHKWATMTP